MRLIRPVLILPQVNAEAERIFNQLSSTVTKKRRSLKPLTVKSLIVAQSCLRSKGWTAATLPEGHSTKRAYEHSCVRKFLRSCVCFTNCFGLSKFYDVRSNVLNCLRIFLLSLIRQNCHQFDNRKMVTTFSH